MTRAGVLSFTAALALHAGILLFGGLLFVRPGAAGATDEEVDLVAAAEDPARKPEEEKKDPDEAREREAEEAEAASEIQESQDPLPDLKDLAALEGPTTAPALDALSLSELTSALGESIGSGDGFAGSFSLASGGRIGGVGMASEGGGGEAVLSIADLDQRPRVVFQSAPAYPQELRRRKVEGTVELVFYVGTDGKVSNVKVERSTDAGFEKPAADAVRRWRFEPGTKNGQKVAFKMRLPITFKAT